MKLAALLLPLLVCLTACDQLGIEDPAKIAAAKEADGKAIGGACRHAMRAIEDCYTLNPKAQKAAVFAGWREMDEYMRDNKLEGVAPVVPRTPIVKPADADADDTGNNSNNSNNTNANAKDDSKASSAANGSSKDDKPAPSAKATKSR